MRCLLLRQRIFFEKASPQPLSEGEGHNHHLTQR